MGKQTKATKAPALTAKQRRHLVAVTRDVVNANGSAVPADDIVNYNASWRIIPSDVSDLAIKFVTDLLKQIIAAIEKAIKDAQGKIKP